VGRNWALDIAISRVYDPASIDFSSIKLAKSCSAESAAVAPS
jgi:hypothetical protein